MSDELKPRESVESQQFRALLVACYDIIEYCGMSEALEYCEQQLIAHINAWGARLAGDAAKDAERYRWLKAASPQLLCAAAWKIPAAAQYSDVDAAVDAARGASPTPDKEPPCGS